MWINGINGLLNITLKKIFDTRSRGYICIHEVDMDTHTSNILDQEPSLNFLCQI